MDLHQENDYFLSCIYTARLLMEENQKFKEEACLYLLSIVDFIERNNNL